MMRQSPRTRWSMALILLTAVASACADKAAPPKIAAALPNNLIAVVVIENPGAAVHEFEQILANPPAALAPALERIDQDPRIMQARMMALGFTASLNLDLDESVAALLGDELALGVAWPQDTEPKLVVASRTAHHAKRDKLINAYELLSGLVVNGQPDAARTRKVHGVRCLAAAPNLIHARSDNLLWVSNDRQLLRKTIAAATDHAPSLAESEAFQDAMKRFPTPARIRVYVNMQQLRQRIPDLKDLPTQFREPLPAFLFADLVGRLRTTDSGAAWAAIGPFGVRAGLDLPADADLPAALSAFFTATDENRTSPLDFTALPNYLGEFSLARHWSQLFADRESFLTAGGAADLVNFSNTLTTLFGGLDFQDGFLPRLKGPTRLVLTRGEPADRQFDPTPTLPAFALISAFDDAGDETLAARLFSAAQSALTILNLDAAQKGAPAYIIDIDKYRNVRLLFTRFGAAPTAMNADAGPDAPPPSQGDVRFNFTPAFAIVDHHFIVATTRPAVEQLIDAVLDRPQAAARAYRPPRDVLQLDFNTLARMLNDNHDELVINRMLEEDLDRASANSDIDLFLSLLGLADRATLTADHTKRGYEMRFSLDLGDWWNAEKP